MQCIDNLLNRSNATENEDFQHLQTAVSFLSTSVGREALLKTLSQGNFIHPLLNCVWPDNNKSSDPVEEQNLRLSNLSCTVRRGYAVEILDFFIRGCDCVEFLKKVKQFVLYK
jgi:hypothetical protein